MTGANSGIGAATAKALGAAGARVTLACRTPSKAKAVADEIGDGATIRQLDLSDLSSVRAFADSIDAVDVLVNNAGIMATPFGRTVDGFELQIGTNHLGHFALAALLMPKLTERVVVVSSIAHRFSTSNGTDLNWEARHYSRRAGYADSKLANLLFGLELARRFDIGGSGRIAAVAHPGFTATNLLGKSQSRFDSLTAIAEKLPLAQPPEAGALPQLFAATSPDAGNGAFYGPDGFLNMRGAPRLERPRRAAGNQELRDRVWAESERLTGIVFPEV